MRNSNNITIYETYAEVDLYNKKHNVIAKAIVSLDKVDLVKKYKWYLLATGYVSAHIEGKSVLLHRFITDVREDELTDHINGDRLDCRDENLRTCNDQQNAMNRCISSNNTSGYPGVIYVAQIGKWRSRIKINGKEKYIGQFKNKDDAVHARINAEILYFKEFAPFQRIANGG